MDAVAGTSGNDTIKGVFGGAADNTFNVADEIDGGAGTDTLELTAAGATASPSAVTVKNVEVVSVRDVVGATVDAQFIENAPAINFTGTIDGNTSTVNNAALASVVGLAGAGNLTVDYATVSGTTDTAKVSLSGVGTSATNVSAVNVSNGNAIEAVEIATSGTNYFTLDAGSAAASVKVTGSGANTMDVSATGATANSVTIDASGATGAQTLKLGTTLSSNDVIKGGSVADKLSATLSTAIILTPTMTGFETADLTFSAAATLDLTKTDDLATVNVVATADSTLRNADATLQTVNVTSGTGDVNVGYATGVAGNLTLNVAGTADISLDDSTLTRVETLDVNFTGGKINYIDQMTVASATSTAVTMDVAASTDGQIEDFYASGITSLSVTVGANGSGDIDAYASGNVGDVTVTTGDLASAYVNVEATSGGVGAVTVSSAQGSGGPDVYVDAYSGGIASIDVTAAGEQSSAYVSAYASGGDIGNITMFGDQNGSGDVDVRAYAEYKLNADNDPVGGNVGNVQIDVEGARASAYFSGTADGGDFGTLTLNIDGASGSAYAYASAYAVLNSAGDAVGGNVGDITVTANGGSADPNVYVYAYGESSAGEYKGGGNIGNISLTVAGASAEAEVNVYGYSGGSVGNIDISVDTAGGGYSGSGDVNAYVYGLGDQIATIGDSTITVTGASDTSGWVNLNAYSGGNIGSVTATAAGAGSGLIDINAYAYVNAAGSAGDVGAISVTDTSFEGDMDIDVRAEGDAGAITASIGAGSANVRVSVSAGDSVGDIMVTLDAAHAGSGGNITVDGTLTTSVGAVVKNATVGQITLAGGSTESDFSDITVYSAGTVAGVDASDFNGSVTINLAGVTNGTEIYAAKDGSTITGTEGADQIYLGAKSDTIILDATPTAADFIYSFKTGATSGDVLDLIADEGTLEAVLSADPVATTADDNDIVRLVDITGGDDITTEAGLLAALNGGEYGNIDATSAGATDYTFVTALDATSTTLYVFHATSVDTSTDFATVTLVGTVEATGAIGTLTADNLA